jgi:hypothetical protein
VRQHRRADKPAAKSAGKSVAPAAVKAAPERPAAAEKPKVNLGI